MSSGRYPRIGISWSAGSGYPAPTLWLPLNVDVEDDSGNGFTRLATTLPSLATDVASPVYSATHLFSSATGTGISFADDPLLNPGTGDFTVTAYVFLDATAPVPEYPSWFGKGSYQSSTGAFNAFFNLSILQYGAGASNPWREASGGAMAGNAWHRMTVTRSGSTMTLYRDATVVDDVSLSGVDLTNAHVFSIGRDLSTTNYWKGYISDFVYIKGTALTLDQITALQTSPYSALL